MRATQRTWEADLEATDLQAAAQRKTGFVQHACGPRLYLGGRRVHHGTVGIALAALALFVQRPRFAAIGLAMIAHDAGDFPWRDCDNHE